VGTMCFHGDEVARL